MVRNTIGDTPLLIRVVCLYVLAVVPVWTAMHIHQSPAPLASVQAPLVVHKPAKQVISGKPIRVKIARLGINLPIIDGKYDKVKDSWVLRDDTAQYATISTLPNDNQGNTFIYGHNTTAVLEPVKGLRVGDTLTIATTNGHVFSYKYISDISVKPNKTDIITAPSKTPRVTLMTCEGIFSKTRRVMYFNFTGVV